MSYMLVPTTMLTTSTLFMSTVMALTSTNWMFLWASMELNMLSFIPIMMMSKKHQEMEGSVKYFLAQALGSAMLLSCSMISWTPFILLQNSMPMVLSMALLLKMGSVPCHFWYPSVMASLSWIPCLVLSSWQKLAPLVILLFFAVSNNKIMISMAAAMNALLGGIMGMNQSQMRTIMAYSSISHIGWIISLCLVEKPMAALLYFAVYCSLITPIILLMNFMNTMSVKQLVKFSANNLPMQVSFITLIMSLGGLPPLTGFMPKLLVIMILSEMSKPIVLMLVAGSVMTLFFYLSIAMNMMAAVSSLMKKNHIKKFYPSMNLLITSNVMTMWMIPLIIY